MLIMNVNMHSIGWIFPLGALIKSWFLSSEGFQVFPASKKKKNRLIENLTITSWAELFVLGAGEMSNVSCHCQKCHNLSLYMIVSYFRVVCQYTVNFRRPFSRHRITTLYWKRFSRDNSCDTAILSGWKLNVYTKGIYMNSERLKLSFYTNNIPVILFY